MPSALPEGEPVPPDGSLPESALAGQGGRPLRLYLHVPFCATRCGYCDFNTYTAAELGSEPGASRDAYLAAVGRELDLALRVLGDSRPLASVFVGGGTPTLLGGGLVDLLGAVLRRFELAADAEVTTEANPESVDPELLERLRAAGFNRISFGMQSARQHVLEILERRHTPGRVPEVVDWARAAGFESVSLDLIYGTPGETMPDWVASLDAALATRPDHLSAYSLIVEPGTRFAARVARGELAVPDEDDLAQKYLLTDQLLTTAGLDAYEVSNWAAAGHECRHNLGYWLGDDWWGIGPGAHSHVGGVRWWNVKHPRSYAGRLAEELTPAAGREVLTEVERRVERVLLELRLRRGLPVEVLTPTEHDRIDELVDRGLVRRAEGRLLLSLRGRLLADAVIRDLLD